VPRIPLGALRYALPPGPVSAPKRTASPPAIPFYDAKAIDAAHAARRRLKVARSAAAAPLSPSPPGLIPEDVALVQAPASPAVERLRITGKHTIPPKPLSREERRLADLPIYPADMQRPKTRGECADGPRPCPWTSCHHHLYLDAQESGSIMLPFPMLDPDELAETCALDVADRGGTTLVEVGRLCGLTRERIRQIEVSGLERVRQHGGDHGPPLDRRGTPLAEIQSEG
jgi:hypothetical protein